MILADKIIENRKKNGWSQEDLAYRLGVSRQSVSKWESAQAVPDMKKILQLSDLFGVSTDYLLRDDIEESDPSVIKEDVYTEDEVRRVSMEEASSFIEYSRKISSSVSTGVMMCILSPILLIVLGALTESDRFHVTEATALGVGITVMLIMIAAAVGIFLSAGLRGKRYEYLENCRIDTDYGVDGMAREQQEKYAETHSRLLIIGIMLCVIAAIPIFVIPLFLQETSDSILGAGVGGILAIIAVGVKLIVKTCIVQESFDKLLEEGDYTKLGKKSGKYDGIYWAIATAIYLTWSFLTNDWHITWLVWPIAGVLFAVFREIVKFSITKNK